MERQGENFPHAYVILSLQIQFSNSSNIFNCFVLVFHSFVFAFASTKNIYILNCSFKVREKGNI